MYLIYCVCYIGTKPKHSGCVCCHLAISSDQEVELWSQLSSYGHLTNQKRISAVCHHMTLKLRCLHDRNYVQEQKPSLGGNKSKEREALLIPVMQLTSLLCSKQNICLTSLSSGMDLLSVHSWLLAMFTGERERVSKA